VSARARFAFAAGVAGLIGSTLLLSGRFDGSVALALLFVAAARIAPSASMIDAGPVLAAGAQRSIARHVSFAPAWALIVAAGALRAASPALSDVRGANAVAGLAIASGQTASIIGAWFAIAAGLIAITSRVSIGAETASSPGSTALVVAPDALRRLEIGAVIAQAALLVTLFAGPQVTGSSDGVAWVLGIAAVSAVAWFARDIEVRHAPLIAAALASIGLALAIAGGTP